MARDRSAIQTAPWYKACALGVGALFLLAVFAPLGALLPLIFWEAYEDYALAVALGLFAIFYTLFVLGLVGLTVLVIRQRARVLDATFAALGLSGSAYAFSGRQYHGQIEERTVHLAYFMPPLIYRAGFRRTRIERTHTLTVERTASPALIASFARHQVEKLAVDQPLYKKPQVDVATRVYEFPILEIKDPDLMHLRVHPSDEGGARALLASPEAKAALLRLLGAFDETWRVEQRFIALRPDAIQLEIIHYVTSDIIAPPAFNAENVRGWIEALDALVDVAEALPPLQMPAGPQWDALQIPHHQHRRARYRAPWLETLRANLVLVLFIASALFVWLCLGCGLLGAGLAVGLDGL
jgi:hypothetical protein